MFLFLAALLQCSVLVKSDDRRAFDLLLDAIAAARVDDAAPPIVSIAADAASADGFLERAASLGMRRAVVLVVLATGRQSATASSDCGDFGVRSRGKGCVVISASDASLVWFAAVVVRRHAPLMYCCCGGGGGGGGGGGCCVAQSFENARSKLIRRLLHRQSAPLLFSDSDVIWRADVRDILEAYAKFFDAGDGSRGRDARSHAARADVDLIFARELVNSTHTVRYGFSNSLSVWYVGARDAARLYVDALLSADDNNNNNNIAMPSDASLEWLVNTDLARREVKYEARQRDVRIGALRVAGNTRLVLGSVPRSFIGTECPTDASVVRCRVAAHDARSAFWSVPPPAADAPLHVPSRVLKAPRVYMIHLPKSAGTSLSAHLRDVLGCTPPGFCCHYPGKPTGVCNETRYGTPCGLFGCIGHGGFHRDAYDFVVLSLREPLARACSAFHYPLHHVPGDTFEQHIRRPRYRNVLARMLSGKRAYTDIWPPKTLDMLKDIVVRYVDAVVTTEQFGETLIAMYEQIERRFGLRPTAGSEKPHQARVSTHDLCNVSASVRNTFERLNRIDIALHKFILDKYVHRMIEIDK